ncbi:MAG: hypothetical protein AB1779_06625 [Candidatus Thermoplasmatota archaeon]
MRKILCALVLSIFLVSILGSANAILVVYEDEDKSANGKYGVKIGMYDWPDLMIGKWNKFQLIVTNTGKVKEKIVLKAKSDYNSVAKLSKKTIVLKPGQTKTVILKVKPTVFEAFSGDSDGSGYGPLGVTSNVKIKAYVKGHSSVAAVLDLDFEIWEDVPVRPMSG